MVIPIASIYEYYKNIGNRQTYENKTLFVFTA